MLGAGQPAFADNHALGDDASGGDANNSNNNNSTTNNFNNSKRASSPFDHDHIAVALERSIPPGVCPFFCALDDTSSPRKVSDFFAAIDKTTNLGVDFAAAREAEWQQHQLAAASARISKSKSRSSSASNLLRSTNGGSAAAGSGVGGGHRAALSSSSAHKRRNNANNSNNMFDDVIDERGGAGTAGLGDDDDDDVDAAPPQRPREVEVDYSRFAQARPTTPLLLIFTFGGLCDCAHWLLDDALQRLPATLHEVLEVVRTRRNAQMGHGASVTLALLVPGRLYMHLSPEQRMLFTFSFSLPRQNFWPARVMSAPLWHFPVSGVAFDDLTCTAYPSSVAQRGGGAGTAGVHARGRGRVSDALASMESSGIGGNNPVGKSNNSNIARVGSALTTAAGGGDLMAASAIDPGDQFGADTLFASLRGGARSSNKLNNNKNVHEENNSVAALTVANLQQHHQALSTAAAASASAPPAIDENKANRAQARGGKVKKEEPPQQPQHLQRRSHHAALPLETAPLLPVAGAGTVVDLSADQLLRIQQHIRHVQDAHFDRLHRHSADHYFDAAGQLFDAVADASGLANFAHGCRERLFFGESLEAVNFHTGGATGSPEDLGPAATDRYVRSALEQGQIVVSGALQRYLWDAIAWTTSFAHPIGGGGCAAFAPSWSRLKVIFAAYALLFDAPVQRHQQQLCTSTASPGVAGAGGGAHMMNRHHQQQLSSRGGRPLQQQQQQQPTAQKQGATKKQSLKADDKTNANKHARQVSAGDPDLVHFTLEGSSHFSPRDDIDPTSSAFHSNNSPSSQFLDPVPVTCDTLLSILPHIMSHLFETDYVPLPGESDASVVPIGGGLSAASVAALRKATSSGGKAASSSAAAAIARGGAGALGSLSRGPSPASATTASTGPAPPVPPSAVLLANSNLAGKNRANFFKSDDDSDIDEDELALLDAENDLDSAEAVAARRHAVMAPALPAVVGGSNLVRSFLVGNASPSLFGPWSSTFLVSGSTIRGGVDTSGASDNTGTSLVGNSSRCLAAIGRVGRAESVNERVSKFLQASRQQLSRYHYAHSAYHHHNYNNNSGSGRQQQQLSGGGGAGFMSTAATPTFYQQQPLPQAGRGAMLNGATPRNAAFGIHLPDQQQQQQNYYYQPQHPHDSRPSAAAAAVPVTGSVVFASQPSLDTFNYTTTSDSGSGRGGGSGGIGVGAAAGSTTYSLSGERMAGWETSEVEAPTIATSIHSVTQERILYALQQFMQLKSPIC